MGNNPSTNLMDDYSWEPINKPQPQVVPKEVVINIPPEKNGHYRNYCPSFLIHGSCNCIRTKENVVFYDRKHPLEYRAKLCMLCFHWVTNPRPCPGAEMCTKQTMVVCKKLHPPNWQYFFN